jgi:hypothetical protein
LLVKVGLCKEMNQVRDQTLETNHESLPLESWIRRGASSEEGTYKIKLILGYEVIVDAIYR